MPPNTRQMSAFEARKARSADRPVNAEAVATMATASQVEKRGPSSPLMGTSKRSFTGAPKDASTSDADGPRDVEEAAGKDLKERSEASSDAMGVTTVEKVDARRLSKLHPTTQAKLRDNVALEVHLEPGDELAIIGQYAIWVLSGAVRIMGALLLPSHRTQVVFAPSTHSLPFIQQVKTPGAPENPRAHVIIISIHTGIRSLGRISKSFKNLWNHQDGTAKSFAYLENSSDDRKGRHLQVLRELQIWRPAMTKITSNKARELTRLPVVFIYGPRNCGKSTFARMLVNRFLTYPNPKFLVENGLDYLDLDPGQPEYSAPGDISLTRVRDLNLGPSYTHPVTTNDEGNTTIWAHHIGDTTPENDTEYFLKCVEQLYSQRDPNVPLVISGCGWTEGKGLEVMEKVVKIVAPELSDAVLFADTDPLPRHFEELVTMFHRAQSTVHLLPVQTHKPKAAREMRMMQAMSYFHIEIPCSPVPKWDSQPLIDDTGEVLSYDGLEPDIYGVMVYGPRVAKSHLPIILNGSICALVAVTEKGRASIRRERSDMHGIPHLCSGILADTKPLHPFESRSLGQVFVRSIEPESRTIRVITPIALKKAIEENRKQNNRLVLVRGRLEAPGWVYHEVSEENQSKQQDEEEWRSYRLRQRQIASSGSAPSGVEGGGEQTSDDDLDLPVEGEDEFGADFYETELPWVDAHSNGGQAGETDEVPKIGGKKWRVRRNLVVGGGN